MAGISFVFTIARVAEMLGEDEEWLREISISMDPEEDRYQYTSSCADVDERNAVGRIECREIGGGRSRISDE